MDFLITHYTPPPRRYPSRLALEVLGFLPRKTNWICRAFSTCNFSFILEGAGHYRLGGRAWEIRAPAVLMQWPGVHVEYGPAAPSKWWTELYLIYPAALMKAFLQNGFVRKDRPVWQIQDFAAVQEKLDDLRKTLLSPAKENTSDRIDRICESLILESLLGQSRTEPEPARKAILAIWRQIRARLRHTPDWNELAASHGLSPATFRRYWSRMSRIPPAQYLSRLRLREARRLLVETSLPIGEIALHCGFEDPLYFSRKFRKEAGLSARTYRETHRSLRGLARRARTKSKAG
jgi:AraC-like DNA-binding protein